MHILLSLLMWLFTLIKMYILIRVALFINTCICKGCQQIMQLGCFKHIHTGLYDAIRLTMGCFVCNRATLHDVATTRVHRAMSLCGVFVMFTNLAAIPRLSC